MATPAQLEVFRNQRLFDGWDEFVAAEHVQAAEASLRPLVEDLLAGASRTCGNKTAKAGKDRNGLQRFKCATLNLTRCLASTQA